ncbi:hypothetical protein D6C98_10849 [Aureobasidium pullulans]|nr:hypothetical protein D6C98_10849 [Aureobasidium pullulans]
MADSFRDVNSVKNYTLSPKAVSEKLADKVNSFDPMAENHDELIVKWDGDSTVSSLFDRTMGATNTMALYTTALLGYVSFLSSSPVITLATPSLASQDNDSDLNDDDSDDIIPNGSWTSRAPAQKILSVHQSVASSPMTTASPPTPTSTTTFFMTSIKGIAPPPTPSCAICGSPVVDSVITHSPILPSSPAVSSFPNSPNNLFTLSDLKHRNLDYIQADSTIYANDSTWRW